MSERREKGGLKKKEDGRTSSGTVKLLEGGLHVDGFQQGTQMSQLSKNFFQYQTEKPKEKGLREGGRVKQRETLCQK